MTNENKICLFIGTTLNNYRYIKQLIQTNFPLIDLCYLSNLNDLNRMNDLNRRSDFTGNYYLLDIDVLQNSSPLQVESLEDLNVILLNLITSELETGESSVLYLPEKPSELIDNRWVGYSFLVALKYQLTLMLNPNISQLILK